MRHEQILRKDGEPISITIRENDLGVLEADSRRDQLDDGLYLTRAWSAQRGGAAPSLDAIFRMPVARSVAEAQAVLRTITISCNWLVADRDGNIGYQQSGRLPTRSHSGLHPVPAWVPASPGAAGCRPNGCSRSSTRPRASSPPPTTSSTRRTVRRPSTCPWGSYRVDRIRSVLGATESGHARRHAAAPERPLLDPGRSGSWPCSGRCCRTCPPPSCSVAGICATTGTRAAPPCFEEVYQRLLSPGLRRRAVRSRGLAGDRRQLQHPGRLLPPLRQRDLLGDDPSWFGDRAVRRCSGEVLEETLAEVDPDRRPALGRPPAGA